MGLPQFTDIISLSDTEISEAIIETENKLFNFRFKKATRQTGKSHDIKHTKRRLAQLKTLMTIRLKERERQRKEEEDKLFYDKLLREIDFKADENTEIIITKEGV